jgi:outer membrane protein
MLRVLLFFCAATDPSSAPLLTLDQAVNTALQRQPSLRQARAGTDAAEGRTEQARAGYLPQLSGTASYLRTTSNFAPRPGANPTLMPGRKSWQTFDFFNFGLAASQLIYDFGQTNGRWRAAEAAEEAFKATEQTIRQQVIFGVQRAYYQALAQEDLVRVTHENLENQQKHLTQTEGLVRAGMRPDIDLARVRTDLANARVGLINAEAGVELAKAFLAQAMGVQQPGPVRLQNEESAPIPGEDGPLSALVDVALEGRPELASLERSRRAQEATIRALQGGYGPSLSATGTATEVGTTLGGLVPNVGVGAVLTWPILQGGLTTGQIREARANLANVNAQIDALRLQVQVDVQQGQVAVRTAKAGGVAADEAIANAREQLRLAEGRYTGGLGSAIELGDAQVAFTGSAAQGVQARYNLATARAQLATALGKR